ncbi:MAG: MerR family transcriptional regulator [Gammaproteobacteria bacterium]
MAKRSYLVKEVAALSGVTVRALHHYDELGLLTPNARSASGYRLYSDDDLLRLQQILIGRELGLSLEAIRRSLDDPKFDRRAALTGQRAELAMRAERAEGMVRAIDAALAALDEAEDKEETHVTNTVDYKKIFDGFDHEHYEPEAKQRWGGTDAYRKSEQRWKAYTEADLERMQEEQGAVYAEAAALRNAGVASDDPRVMDVAEQHRLSFDRWFYPCSHTMHASLADMWETDTRYLINMDKQGGDGFTKYLAAAVRANAARAQGA